MRTDHYFDSCGKGKNHYCRWTPEGEIKGILQIVHGIAEFVERYDDFANYLTTEGYLVVAEDHMGHGKSIEGGSTQGFFHGGWFAAVDDTYKLMQDTMAAHPGVPYVLFGHSMGSFMAQHSLTRYTDLDGLILSGSTTASPLVKVGAILAKLMCLFSIDKTKPSPFLNAMAFGSYNKAFPDAKTDFDWLSRDAQQVQKYIDDPLCGGICSVSFYQNLTAGMASMGKPALLAKISKDLPIYIQGGGKDPVSEMGQGLYSLKQQYDALQIRWVKLDVYPEARHEIFNELNRDEVYHNTLNFILTIAKD